jgi:sirohydrochlorin cobaltochelatase
VAGSFCTILLGITSAGCRFAGAAQGEGSSMNLAILLVAFGSTAPEAQKALDQIDAQTRKAFPGVEVRWAYTSRIIRAKLAEQGKHLDSPEVALARLMDDRVSRVAVLSLHTIPGLEFHDLAANARLFGQMAGGFKGLAVAGPLLSSRDDMVRAARAMLKQVPPGRQPGDAVILMGHGSEKHPADAIYAAMNALFQEMDARVFLATVQGYPSLTDILPRLPKGGANQVYLLPFMSVAGEHARKDMASDDPASWKSVLTHHGYHCEVVLKGTAEYPEMVEIWLDHLRAVVARLAKI